MKIFFANIVQNTEYILKGFGYMSINDFKTTMFKIFYMQNFSFLLSISVGQGIARELMETALGLDIIVVGAFAALVVAEWQTGIKADVIKRKKKFRSRKFGRMLFKIFIYLFLLWILNSLSTHTNHLSFDGFELNPFRALFYVVFVGIILQLLISYLENLGTLGYSEAKGLAGIVLRKYNQWFEFDGSKDSDKDFEEDGHSDNPENTKNNELH